VPIDSATGVVRDATRIIRLAPTMVELANQGARVVVISHFGRPQGHEKQYTLEKISLAFAHALNREVKFFPDTIGDGVRREISHMKNGDILVLENTRFYKEEEANDAAFAAQLASLANVYVNDAFSCAHRAHASTAGVAHHLPSYAGRLMQAELEALSTALENPKRPVLAVVGGSKISTKLSLLNNLIAKVNSLALGGAMANTMLLARGQNIAKSLAEHDMLDIARDIMTTASKQNCEILLPIDACAGKKLAPDQPVRMVTLDKLEADEMILDIGPQSITALQRKLTSCRTVLWNGPLGAFEIKPFDTGTNMVAQAVAERSTAGQLVSVAGGGDTVAALNAAGVADHFTYL